MADETMIQRLAEGEDPWLVDPEHGCADPITGYFPTQLVDDYIARHIDRKFAQDEPLVVIAGEGDQEIEYVRADAYDVIVAAMHAMLTMLADAAQGRLEQAKARMPVIAEAEKLLDCVSEERRRLRG